MQNMQSTVFILNVLVGNCMSTCNVHIQKHSSKKQISFVSFTVYYRRYSSVYSTVYNMIEQKTFYSIAYSEQNIHETHKSILERQKQQSKKTQSGKRRVGGLKSHTEHSMERGLVVWRGASAIFWWLAADMPFIKAWHP